MKNNTLVLIDWGAGFLISPLIIIIKIIKKIAVRFYKPKRSGQLVVKFLGAGNYVAMSDLIDENTTLISASSNKLAIQHFLKPRQVFYIDDSGFIPLVLTSLGAIVFVLRNSYFKVINLETESKFSKLLITLARTDITLGITNVHKSYMDKIVYDHYLVNPSMIGKSDSLTLLTSFKLIQNEHALAAIHKSQYDFLQHVKFMKTVTKIAFAPTGSDTDTIRRVKPEIWLSVANKLFSCFPNAKIDLYFPSINDIQYQELTDIFVTDKRVEIRIDSYGEYIAGIKQSNLVVCIDSQTLHVANHYEVPAICFFGPSSPYGVNHSRSTYPVSVAAACSPCRHKYFEIPCRGKTPCMDFADSDLRIFEQLGDLCT